MSLKNSERLSWQEDVKVAKELLYPQKVIDMLTEEPDSIRRSRILYDARNGKYGRR